MRYLYKVLRLFFCPHRFQINRVVNLIEDENSIIPNAYNILNRCKYCGELKKFRY
jgi:hypothetical protein